MKFDGFRHPREQIAPITLAGTIRNQPVRLLFYRTPFLGLFFTIGFVLLPYIGHKLDKKGKFIYQCFAAARKDLMRQLNERKRNHTNGEVQFERDYHYLKHHLFHSWEKNHYRIGNIFPSKVCRNIICSTVHVDVHLCTVFCIRIAFESNHNGRVRHSVTMMMLEAICRIEFKAQRDLMLVHGVEDHFPCYSD
ncbi:hypothetical protein T4B_7462 [Trichinella pseudospiralis]|uniref:Uncharacterized protein n=1 Tax=Trichinella pseudospiralis TaxID=6337 RepID=A0A0V1J0T1_TRIPS|nr:hypothetical protein T4B_7462 [Trichinella pseudospiralis]KRZ35303.1 hypothetical protein T4C_3336 [Trichinella pseudospiralis]